MGLFNIYRLCASVLFASAVIFSAIYSLSVSAAIESPNYFYDAPSRTWIPTRDAVITPKGTVINNSAANQAQRFLDGNGGYSNKSKITANFPKVNKSVPITINARVTPTAVKSAAKTVLKGGVATIALGAGLNALLDGLDWVMGEGGQIQKQIPIPSTHGSGGYLSHGRDFENISCPTIINPFVCPAGCQIQDTRSVADYEIYTVSYCSGRRLVSTSKASGFGEYKYFSSTENGNVPAAEIDSAVDSKYSPALDDYPALAPYLPPESTFLDPIPRVNEPVSTTTVTDLDTGVTTTTETNIWHDFDISNNPSAKPKIDVKTTEETNTYKDGQLSSTSTKTETSPADTEQPSAGGAVPPPEIPTDCDFHPTLCAWMDWTKQNDLDDEPDLKAIMHDFEPSNTNFTVSGAKSCPAPYSIHIALIDKTVELSFEPACTFAGYLYFFVMAGAYVFAAYITLGVARNG